MSQSYSITKDFKSQLLHYSKAILPYFTGLFIVVYFFALNVTSHKMEFFPGDMGDGRFNNYLLENSHKFITGAEPSLWNAPFMFPEKDVITYSDNLVGSVPFYSIFRVAGYDRETSYQLWFIMMYALNFSCAYAFLNWCFKNRYAAVLGALIFAVSIALQSQMTHAQTFPRYAVPLAIWMSFLFFKHFNPRYFFLAIFFVVYQFYCGIYLGFFLFIPVGILLASIFIVHRKKLITQIKDKKWLLSMIGALVLNVILIAPLMLPYLERAKATSMNQYENIVSSIPTVRSFLYSQNGSALWDSLSDVGGDYTAFWDHQIFVGGTGFLSFIFLSIIGIIWLIVKKPSLKVKLTKIQLIFLITCWLTFILFIRFQGFSLYQVVFKIPGFASLRSLTRVINIELIFFAFSASFAAFLIFKRFAKYQLLIFVGLLALLVLDNYFYEGKSYRMEKAYSQNRIETLTEKMKFIPVGSVISYEPDTLINNVIDYQIDGMLAAQSMGMKSLNGYSATAPNGFSAYWNNPNEETRKIWLKEKNMDTLELFVIK